MPGKPQKATVVENQLREVDLAYLAGLVDGDGSIRSQYIAPPSRIKSGRRPRTTYSIVVYNYNFEVMEWLVSTFGGFWVHNPKSKNKFVGANKKEYLRTADSFTWIMTRLRDVEIILRRIIRYLIIKRAKGIYILGEVRSKLRARLH